MAGLIEQAFQERRERRDAAIVAVGSALLVVGTAHAKGKQLTAEVCTELAEKIVDLVAVHAVDVVEALIRSEEDRST